MVCPAVARHVPFPSESCSNRAESILSWLSLELSFIDFDHVSFILADDKLGPSFGFLDRTKWMSIFRLFFRRGGRSGCRKLSETLVSLLYKSMDRGSSMVGDTISYRSVFSLFIGKLHSSSNFQIYSSTSGEVLWIAACHFVFRVNGGCC